MFKESAILNNRTYRQYLDRLTELSIAMFQWDNLPDTVDQRYFEMRLFENGSVIFFEDEVMGCLCLDNIQSGQFDVYGNPILRRAYSSYNQYQKMLTNKNSVIIWNNYLKTNSILDVKMFALRLANIDRIIDINVNAQKTPVLLQGSEKQRLTLLNLYKEFDGNAPVIFGDKNLDVNGLSVLKTDAPYVADSLYQLKTQIWNEALTYLGISNVNITKKERLVTDEVQRSQGGTIASRYSRLEMRRKACEEINKMFHLNISVDYRQDYREIDDYEQIINDETIGGDDNE